MKNESILVSILALSALAACSSKVDPAAPIVQDVKTTPQPAPKAELSPTGTGSTEAVVSEVTLTKAQILDRVFLYGSDLQYSAVKDGELDLTLQSMAVGHFPTEFKIVGSNLQLVIDQSANFESDVNHPGRLVTQFPIVRQDSTTVTIKIERASPILITALTDAKAPPERTSWVRSVKFVAEGNYLMWESSVEAANGDIGEFMEAVFPRDTLVTKDTKVLLNDADHEPLADRYRFLGAGKVWLSLDDGRTQTEAASRFALPAAGKTIDWYVTPNVPEEFLPQIKTAIEGWNRYSQKMWSRDFVRFVGRLPEGIKIGDPRYNVVNWDSVAEAGAAYESQATDPTTGLQSHSLIYLPLAWVNIGKDYWSRGEFSEKTNKAADQINTMIASRSVLGRALPVHCVADPRMTLSATARANQDEFSRELLKGVLFHEVGHAFGLAHNFKGSLSLDPHNDDTLFSTSIMDYNQYNIESRAFDSVESDKGPLLEYDRQIISVLYNDGKDIVDSPVVPTCNDEETDSLVDGVDPLCIRYDAGHDPTQQLELTTKLLTDADSTSTKTLSLPTALRQLASLLGNAADVKTLDDAKAAAKKVGTAAYGVINFYVYSGAGSLSYMSRANVRSLYVFKKDILPESYKELDMRDRALKGLQFVAGLTELPKASDAALKDLAASVEAWLKTTAAVQALPASDRDAKASELVKDILSAKTKAEDPSASGLFTKLRGRVLGTLVRVPTAPFYYLKTVDSSTDLETASLALLENGLVSQVSGKARALAERLSVATALKTFADTSAGKAALTRVKASITQELDASITAQTREDLRSLLKKLD